MGFFDTLKCLATKAKCLTGFHAGSFKPIEGKPECHVEKTCPDCGEYITSYQHRFADWLYVYMDFCDQERVCNLCGTREQRKEHHYQVVGIDDRSYEQLQCNRCNERQQGHEKHSWGGWSKQGDKAIRICSRCGAGESRNLTS